MFKPRQAVVVGASSGVGRALAECLASEGCRLVLSSRDRRDLDAVAADAVVRGAASVEAVTVDLGDPGFRVEAYIADCRKALPALDSVFITAGMVSDEDDGLPRPDLVRTIITVNYLAVVQLAAGFARELEKQGGGRLILFSSIAAAAPRKRNVAYASAKAGLEAFARGLQHRYAFSRVGIQVVAPGYVDSTMTFGRKLLFPLARADKVAMAVLKHLNSPVRFRYLPWYWGLIVRMLNMLPWPIYRRLSF